MATAAKKTVPAKKTISTSGIAAKKPAVKKTSAAKKPALPTFQAPADFKPFFLEVEFSTGADGLISSGTFSANRVRGKWDNADNPRYEMKTYDVDTAIQIACRLSSVTYAANITKRLPADVSFRLVLRIGRKTDTNALTGRVVAMAMTNAAGKMRWVKDKADPVYRRLRRSARILPSAFTEVQLPPKKRRGSAASSDE